MALIFHSHASQRVNRLLENTRTHLITDKAGGHIPDDESKNNKHTDTKSEEERFIDLHTETR